MLQKVILIGTSIAPKKYGIIGVDYTSGSSPAAGTDKRAILNCFL